MTTHQRPLTQAEYDDSVTRFQAAITEGLAELRAENAGPRHAALLDKVEANVLAALTAKLGTPQG